jgi:hypothetical protein
MKRDHGKKREEIIITASTNNKLHLRARAAPSSLTAIQTWSLPFSAVRSADIPPVSLPAPS